MVNVYSKAKDGNKSIAKNFTVKEFACNDGSDKVLIDNNLPVVLQKIRDHFNTAVFLNSAYRTPAYNAKVGGVSNSQHTKGTAADIRVSGIAPLKVAQYAEYLMPKSGGIGVYSDFVHVDVRAVRARWDNRSGKEVSVAGWPGYVEPKPTEKENTNMAITIYGTINDVPKMYQSSVLKAMKKGVLSGYVDTDPNRYDDNVLNMDETLCRVCTMLDALKLLD